MDKNDWIKSGIFLAAIIVTAFLFPRSQYFNFDYSKASPWEHEDLIAPYDFAMIKSEVELDEERANIRKSFIPNYQRSNESKDQYLAKLNWNYALNPIAYSILANSFDAGIYDSEELTKYKQDKIRVYQGGKEEIIRKSNVSTTSTVINALSDFVAQDTLELINKNLKPNISLNLEANQKELAEALEAINQEKGFIKKGEMIARKGDIVSDELALKVEALQKSFNTERTSGIASWLVFLGYILLTFLIYASLLFFIKTHYPKIYQDNIKIAFILIWPILFAFLVSLVESNSQLSTYIIPFCIVPIIVSNFYSNRLALFIHIVVVLIASFLSRLGYEFTFLQILAGIVTVLMVSETRQWNQFFKAIGVILSVYFIGYLGLELIKEASISEVGYDVFGWLLMNGIFLLLAYPFIPIIERIFGFTSSITLAELSDLNNKILKDLSINAPGTFQHSLQVANLAEAAVKEIGGDSLLTKVAGLYHDIGKTSKAEYFIENQDNIESPHNKLTNIESASIIINHVAEGIKIAKKEKLPQIIIDFIETHHGTTRVEYFYRKQKEAQNSGHVDQDLFTYPGPKPVTKEQTVMMIADSIEAAGKSLKSPTGQDIDKLVDKIIDHKIDSDQLSQSELTFDDLEKCAKVFKKLLRSIYHVRIEYPEEQVSKP